LAQISILSKGVCRKKKAEKGADFVLWIPPVFLLVAILQKSI